MRIVRQVTPRCRGWGHSRQHSSLENRLDLSPRWRGLPGICHGHLCHGGVCEESGLEVNCREVRRGECSESSCGVVVPGDGARASVQEHLALVGHALGGWGC